MTNKVRRAIRLGKWGRLNRLLEVGYFPEELPPPFVSHTFARFRRSLLREWMGVPQFENFRSRPEHLTIPRFAAARRRATIPNPVNYFRLSHLIAQEWREIRDFIATSKITEFRPIFDAEGPRSIFRLDFGIVDRRTAEILSEYNHVFKTDITRFYHSIYTHSIAWALHEKSWVKANMRSPGFKASLGNKLDFELRKGQEDQTIGIPIGPDTSRIISEIIAVGLERELAKRLRDLDRRSVRYVDDILIGYDESESDELITAALEGAMSHYELDINISKTKTLGVKEREKIQWISELRACRVRLFPAAAQREDIERFFRTALVLAEENEKDSVLKWATKRSRSFNVSNQNFEFLCDYIIRITRKAPACLPILAQALIDANNAGRPIPRVRIQKFVDDIIAIHSPVGHAFEVGWALFIAKGLRLKLKSDQLKDAFILESSMTALLCMDLNNRSLIEGGVREDAWLPYASEEGLSSPMWLLAYEAAKKGWWASRDRAYVENSPLFGPMLRRGVSFYDEKRNVPKLRRELRDAKTQRIRVGIILNHWMDYF